MLLGNASPSPLPDVPQSQVAVVDALGRCKWQDCSMPGPGRSWQTLLGSKEPSGDAQKY